jgi:hypothetical protein
MGAAALAEIAGRSYARSVAQRARRERERAMFNVNETKEGA